MPQVHLTSMSSLRHIKMFIWSDSRKHIRASPSSLNKGLERERLCGHRYFHLHLPDYPRHTLVRRLGSGQTLLKPDPAQARPSSSQTLLRLDPAQARHFGLCQMIIMANVIPLDHVDDIVEPNQPDVVSVIPEPVLVDEDEDPEEEEFEEEKEPQEEDMDIDDEEDENETELTFPYEKADPLNPSPSAFDSESKDVIEVEDTVEPEDETVSASVHEKGNAKDKYYGTLILDLGNEVRSSMEEGAAAMENLVRKLSNAEERAEHKKLKKELEEARFSNTLLHMQNEQVERDLYWTRVQAHRFYQEMIRRGVMFEERPNEAIDVLVTTAWERLLRFIDLMIQKDQDQHHGILEDGGF
nr:hypothetical protein [Tanacetum cinerariifolium]